MISQTRALMLLRLSLGVIFFWFGILTLFNVSPALTMITKSLPAFLGESQLFLFLLALLEILIGLAFFTNRFIKVAAIVMIISVGIEIILVLFTQGFDPRFPILSLAGGYALKSLAIVAAGFVFLADKKGENKE